jgi:hypothetical protein
MIEAVTQITREDIRNLLKGYAAAIELDQIRVDALPPQRVHQFYDDNMWRSCRRDHIDFVNRLLPTVKMIPTAMLDELTWLAVSYEPSAMREAILDLFCDAAYELCPPEEFETAEMFFGWLIKEARMRTPGEPLRGDARWLIMQWVCVTDPLRIAQDPECGYGRPRGFVS